MRTRAAAIVDPDVGRLVLTCSECDRARPWSGWAEAIAAGWRSRWIDERRRWFCGACWTPPAASVEVALAALPGAVALVHRCLRNKDGRLQEAAQDMIARLRERPEQLIATLDEIAKDLKGRRTAAATAWRDFVDQQRRTLSAAERTINLFAKLAALRARSTRRHTDAAAA